MPRAHLPQIEYQGVIGELDLVKAHTPKMLVIFQQVSAAIPLLAAALNGRMTRPSRAYRDACVPVSRFTASRANPHGVAGIRSAFLGRSRNSSFPIPPSSRNYCGATIEINAPVVKTIAD